MTFLPVTTLATSSTGDAAGILAAVTEAGLANAFNVSLARDDDRWAYAFRALPPRGGPPFGAWLGWWQGGSGASPLIDLAAHAAAHGIATTSDPKLFRFRGQTWVTFNTGTPDRGHNELHVVPIGGGTLGQPVRCMLEGRALIEKNWAFVEHEGNLRVVYCLDPLTVLELVDTSPTEWRFAVVAGAVGQTNVRRSLSLGTPLVQFGDRLIGVAHQRFVAFGRRTYVGRPVSVDLDSGRVEVGGDRLVHRWSSVLGSRVRHNPNLWSCTYFAGVAVHGEQVLLGYGVNDVRPGVADVSRLGLW